MEWIALEGWPRREQFEYFCGLDHPQYDLCAPVDATGLYALARERGYSFYHAMGHTVTRAANAVPALRMRIREGRPLIHERVHPSFTEPRAGGALFKCVGVAWCGDLEPFLRRCEEASERQGDRFLEPANEARDDFLYLSCLPWVAFTSVTQAHGFDRFGSVPQITWGKYTKREGRVTLPLSLTVHHGLCDGSQAGEFFETLQGMLDAY